MTPAAFMPLQLAAKRLCVLYVPCVALTMPKRTPAARTLVQSTAPCPSARSTPSTVVVGAHALLSLRAATSSPLPAAVSSLVDTRPPTADGEDETQRERAHGAGVE